eukprot:388491-Pyramimonas_sp.AAC.3
MDPLKHACCWRAHPRCARRAPRRAPGWRGCVGGGWQPWPTLPPCPARAPWRARPSRPCRAAACCAPTRTSPIRPSPGSSSLPCAAVPAPAAPPRRSPPAARTLASSIFGSLPMFQLQLINSNNILKRLHPNLLTLLTRTNPG